MQIQLGLARRPRRWDAQSGKKNGKHDEGKTGDGQDDESIDSSAACSTDDVFVLLKKKNGKIDLLRTREIEIAEDWFSTKGSFACGARS